MPTSVITYPNSSDWPATSELLTEDDDVRSGIWPASPAFWFSCLYVAIYIIRPWEKLFPWLAAIHFERSFVVLLVAMVAAERGFRMTLDRQTVTVLLFIAALCLSTLNAFDTTQAWGGQGGLYAYLTTVFAYFLFSVVVRTKYELAFLVTCQLVATGLYVGKSLWEFYIHGAGYHTMGVLRLQGIDLTFSHPNAVAALISCSLPVVLFLWRTKDSFTSTWPTFWRTWFPRSLWIYLGMSAVALLATNSRTGVVSVVVFGLLVVRRQASLNRMIHILAAFSVVAVLAWMWMPEESRNRVRSIWESEAGGKSAQESTEGRILGFWQGMEMFKRCPMTGVGVGNYIIYRVHFLDGIQLDSHNLAAQLLSQIGLLGTVCFLAMFGVTVWNARSLMSSAEPSQNADDPPNFYREFGLMIGDTLVLLQLQGLSNHNLYHFNWVWVAAFAALALRLRGQEWDPA